MDASVATDVLDLEQIVQGLDVGMDRLPEQALRAAQQQRAAITPRLIELLQKTTEQARAGIVPEGNAHLFALYLLAEFKATEALPAIVEIVSLPGELPTDLFGDSIHDGLPRILASLASDRLEIIDSLIGNPAVNEYVRWAAADAYNYLVRDGLLPRAAAVERLRQHLRSALDDEQGLQVNGLVMTLVDLWPSEARAEITEAFQRELVDRFFIEEESIEEMLAAGEVQALQRLRKSKPADMGDVVEELRRWHCFQPKPEPRHPQQNWGQTVADPLHPQLPADDYDLLPDELEQPERRYGGDTIVNDSPHVGRNDPCPCGSGKKYKKCCLRNQNPK